MSGKKPSLFAREEALAESARAAIEKSGQLGETEARAILKAYEKLLKSSKRLMRLSDVNERALRTANDAVGQKNLELEALSVRLSKYLSPQVYERVFTDENAVDLTAERKRLTVLFSDLVGFTDLADQLEPEELTQILNTYLGAMAELVIDHGGTIDKFMGDGLMVFFGDPTSAGVQKDALACVRLGIAMQDRLAELVSEWRAGGFNATLACRIGIHTGYATVGNFGSPKRMDYTLVGSAVNLAARLETSAEPGAILLSQSTQSLVAGEVATTALPPFEIKGFARPIEAFRVDRGAFDDTARIGRELAERAAALVGLSGAARAEALKEAEALLTALKNAGESD